MNILNQFVVFHHLQLLISHYFIAIISRHFLKGGKDDESNALLAHHDKRVGPHGKNLESLESAHSSTATQS
jgi:hypothetical protein